MTIDRLLALKDDIFTAYDTYFTDDLQCSEELILAIRDFASVAAAVQPFRLPLDAERVAPASTDADEGLLTAAQQHLFFTFVGLAYQLSRPCSDPDCDGCDRSLSGVADNAHMLLHLAASSDQLTSEALAEVARFGCEEAEATVLDNAALDPIHFFLLESELARDTTEDEDEDEAQGDWVATVEMRFRD